MGVGGERGGGGGGERGGGGIGERGSGRGERGVGAERVIGNTVEPPPPHKKTLWGHKKNVPIKDFRGALL